MIQRLYVALLIVSLAQSYAIGQPNQPAPNPIAFGMIRSTTEFLATDTKTFGYRTIIPCLPCETYADLNQFATKNRLMGADKLIADARNVASVAMKTDSAQMPDKLRSFLLSRITSGTHAYRTDLPGFATYVQSLSATTNSIEEQPAEASSVSEGGDLAPLDGTTDTNTVNTETFLNNPTDQSANTFSIMDYFALALSILSLAGVGILWFRKPVVSTQPVVLPDDKINQLAGKITKLERDNRQLQDDLITLRKSIGASGKTVAPLQRTIQATVSPQQSVSQPEYPAEAVASPELVPSRPPASVLPVAPPSNPYQNPTLLYGRTADLGDGFSVRGLLEKPDRDTIFEIVRTDATRATFQVSDNPALQQLALSDAYSYLNDTCVYTTQPKPGNRIRTEKPGTLSLQGEKWVITDKAQISFLG